MSEKLLEAMGRVGFVAKDKTNKHGGYDYQSETAMKQAAHKAFVATGIMPDRVLVEVLCREMVPSKKGGQQLYREVMVTYRFGDRAYQGVGAGMDYGDKALMKAQTAAIREALKGMFTTPSGNDPEAESPEHNAHAVSGKAPELTTDSVLPKGDHKGTRLIDCPAEYLERMAGGDHEWAAPAKRALAIINARAAGFSEEDAA